MFKGQGHFNFAKGTSIGKSKESQWEIFEGHQGQDKGQQRPRPPWPACYSKPDFKNSLSDKLHNFFISINMF